MFIGRHIIADLTLSSPHTIQSEKLLTEFLLALSKRLSMNILQGPVVGNALPNMVSAEDVGTSVSVIWYESHATIHAWPARLFASLDIYSCKDFDSNVAIDVIDTSFDVKTLHGLEIVRNTDTPQTVQPFYLLS